MIKNFQQSSHPLYPAVPLLVSSKIVVTSPKKSKKKGKAAPAMIADIDPMINKNFSDAVVYEKRDKKDEGGVFFS